LLGAQGHQHHVVGERRQPGAIDGDDQLAAVRSGRVAEEGSLEMCPGDGGAAKVGAGHRHRDPL
jgi:hypothetical protein